MDFANDADCRMSAHSCAQLTSPSLRKRALEPALMRCVNSDGRRQLPGIPLISSAVVWPLSAAQRGSPERRLPAAGLFSNSPYLEIFQMIGKRKSSGNIRRAGRLEADFGQKEAELEKTQAELEKASEAQLWLRLSWRR